MSKHIEELKRQLPALKKLSAEEPKNSNCLTRLVKALEQTIQEHDTILHPDRRTKKLFPCVLYFKSAKEVDEFTVMVKAANPRLVEGDIRP